MSQPATSVARAFTLVECLAVVALMALVVGVLAVGLAPSTAHARLRDARSAILDLDARARVLAHGGEPAFLRIEAGRAVVEQGGESVLARDLPRSLNATLADPESRDMLPAVRFGTQGLGPDYVILLRSGDASSGTLVCGLTGYAFGPGGEGRR